MKLLWTEPALLDLERLHDFIALHNAEAAAAAVARLTAAAEHLFRFPLMGPAIAYRPDKQLRRLIVDRYEIHYRVVGQTIRILRVWSTRENR